MQLLGWQLGPTQVARLVVLALPRLVSEHQAGSVMVLGVFLIATGLALTVTGVLATLRPRPVNLAGALLAPLGLLIAFAGVARLLQPGFFGG